MDAAYSQRVETAAAALAARTSHRPSLLIVLGSGLSGVASAFPGDEIPYGELPGFPQSTVAGHKGVFRIGPQAALMVGRFHYYEGWDLADVVLPFFVLKELGVKTVVLTNAAGGIADRFQPGDLVLISDHLNLLAASPFRGPNDSRFGPRFFDMGSVYTPALRRQARDLWRELFPEAPALEEGVYAIFPGPAYETPAEIRMLRTLGADLVGMSTVPEATAARYLGLNCLALSCVTNKAAGLSPAPLDHAEVVEVGRQVEARLGALLRALVPRLD